MDLFLKSFWQSFISQTTLKHQHSSCSFLRAEVWWVDFCSCLWLLYCFSPFFLQPNCPIQASPWLCWAHHSVGSRKEADSALTLALILVPLDPNPNVVDGGGWLQEGKVEWERWQMMWGESRAVKMIMAGRGRASWLWLARPAFACWHWEAKRSLWGKAMGGWGLGSATGEKESESARENTVALCVWGGKAAQAWKTDQSSRHSGGR